MGYTIFSSGIPSPNSAAFKTQNTAGLNYWLMEDLFMMELELYFIFFFTEFNIIPLH